MMPCRIRYLSCSFFLLVACAPAQDPDPASTPPSAASERFRYYLQRTYSWQKMSWLAVDSAVDHLLGEAEWGHGIGGYGCRYASGFGRRLINNTVEFGAVMVLRQDTRFLPSKRKGLIPRIRYAATHAFLASG